MKNLFIALALLVGASAYAHDGHHHAVTPAWSCAIKAEVVHDNRFYVIFKGGEIHAHGTMECIDPVGGISTSMVKVDVKEFGVGIGFGFPVEKSKLDMVKISGGVSHPADMYGQFQLRAGPGLTLVGKRIGFEGGLDAGHGIGAGIQLRVENMVGIGVDFTTAIVTIAPCPHTPN